MTIIINSQTEFGYYNWFSDNFLKQITRYIKSMAISKDPAHSNSFPFTPIKQAGRMYTRKWRNRPTDTHKTQNFQPYRRHKQEWNQIPISCLRRRKACSVTTRSYVKALNSRKARLKKKKKKKKEKKKKKLCNWKMSSLVVPP